MDLLEPALDRIALVEAAAADALRPAEEQRRDGWRLRFNRGVSRRGNSVLPEARGGRPLEDKLDEAEAFYRQRGLPPRVQITPASQPSDLDVRLAERGYRSELGAQVLWGATATLARGLEVAADPAAVDVRRASGPDPDYLEVLRTADAGAAEMAQRRASRSFQAGLLPGHFVLEEGERPVACGLCVFDPDRKMAGVFNLATHPEARGRGLAGALLVAMAAWAGSRGAEGLYLQVDERNEPAQRAYARAGFARHHAYHYRVAAD